MSNFAGIFNAEEWVSDHYFTAEKGTCFAAAQRQVVRGWKDDEKDGHSTPMSRFSTARTELLTLLLQGEEQPEQTSVQVSAILRRILGYGGEPEAILFERGDADYRITGNAYGPHQEVVWLTATPAKSADDALAESFLLGEAVMNGKDRANGQRDKLSVAKIVSALFLADQAPRFIVVSAGGFLFLCGRERWPEGRYVAVDVALVAERNATAVDGEVNRFLTLFDYRSLVPDVTGNIWMDERLEESREHAVGVSQDLRDGIRESIEIIANDVLKRRECAGMSNDQVDPQELARQSLRFLYRILFLLYAEASPELGVLPKGAGEYDTGYGLDRLRGLTQVNLSNIQTQRGTHIYESLALLFELVNGNHPSQTAKRDQQPHHESDGKYGFAAEGLVFEPLKADLFEPAATSLIDEVGLSNAELQQVLQRLLLSKKSAAERGFISYANLGINQLGAVYEGLMSYTGFIADQPLYEVAPNGNPEKGSWVVPREQYEQIDEKHYVQRIDELTGRRLPAFYPTGSFVYRLAGRERQQSASYYTPEVLTRFVVEQSLAELLTDNMTADEVLELSVCEPALGSGAFAIEAVRQLAAEYLKRKQVELGRQIPADEYPLELQRVKAHIALHQVYGVDLNSTAVELAEISLWLDTMLPNLHAPWFGLRLQRGNSLIGAKRAVYSEKEIKAKKYLKEAPRALPLTNLAHLSLGEVDEDRQDGIHHFLLPAAGWGAASGAKELKGIADEDMKQLRGWGRAMQRKLTATEIKSLRALAQRVERLWQIVHQRLLIAESEAKRFVDYWPHERDRETTTVTRSQIEASLNDRDGAYQRLKRVMDAWCALWFWPLNSEVEPPTIDEWLAGLTDVLGTPYDDRKNPAKQTLVDGGDWEELNTLEDVDRAFAQAKPTPTCLDTHPWLNVCEQLAKEQGFFHWELTFAPVFARGGFDLQVGNPPWVRPDFDEKAVYAEFDPWWQLAAKPKQVEKRERQQLALADADFRSTLTRLAGELTATREYLTSAPEYPIVGELRPDLYRSFMEATWSRTSDVGVVGLIHPISHFTEKRAGVLRAETYRRLRRVWQFVNEKQLFEIHHLVSYGVNIYGARQNAPSFLAAFGLYHPETVTRSLNHDGSGPLPGLKDDNNEWDLRPHATRIVHADEQLLAEWASINDEPGTPPLQATMAFPVNTDSMRVLSKLAKAPRVRELGLQFSSGWNETTARRQGYFEVESAVNDTWDDVILQGPFFQIATPLAQEPRASMRNNLDYEVLDLEALPVDFIPRTSYQPNRTGEVDYDHDYGYWTADNGEKVPVRSQYRIAWRRMAGPTAMRTFFPAIIPPGAAHIDNVTSLGRFGSVRALLAQAALFASLPVDFMIRLGASSKINRSHIYALPSFVEPSPYISGLVERSARLNCLTEAYTSLWNTAMGTAWTKDSPARKDRERRQLLVEIDALAALQLGLTIDELCAIYRTQFSVLHHRYEKVDLYDANGRLVPKYIAKLNEKAGSETLSEEERTWTHPQSGVTYVSEYPFVTLDREADMREAYIRFEGATKGKMGGRAGA